MRVALPLLVATLAMSGLVSPVAAQSPASGGLASPLSTNPFLGGVPTGAVSPEPLRLTVGDAIGRALEHNLGLLLAEDGASRAQAGRVLALSALLPNVNGRVAENRQVVNLAAFGFPLPAGTPTLVGPFNVFDARVSVQQSLLDFRALNDLRAERHAVAAADLSTKSARDVVVLVAANAYLQALAAAARADSAQAQLRTAEALFSQATNLKAGGLVAGIDVLRAELQVSTQRQRATAAANSSDKARLQLGRVIGLPPGQAFTLVEELPNVPAPTMSLEMAIDQALKSRPDYLAAQERVRAAESSRQAAVSESLPSIRVSADYGAIGLTPSTVERTYSVAGAVTVPIFQGGRRRGRLLDTDAVLRSRKAEADNLRSEIDYDVRAAFLDLKATEEQLTVATSARELADRQLTQARDRLAAGVANTIEVVQAQEAVSLASEQYIAALYGFNIAKAVLARGMGIAEEAARQYIGGIR